MGFTNEPASEKRNQEQFASRSVIKEIVIAGVKFSKGTKIVVVTAGNKYDKKFIDSHAFRPERFENEVPKFKRYDYIPFFEGKGKCPGYQMATFMMQIMMGYLNNKLELSVEKNYQIIMDSKSSYHCSNPKMDVKLRYPLIKLE